MSKIKITVRTPRIDMTPMVDLFMLLLTFFMLTASFRPTEAVEVDTPNSVSEKASPEKNVITVFIDKDNKVYFNVDDGKDTSQHVRRKTLEEMGRLYKMRFTTEQISKFEKSASFGMPMVDLKKWLDATDPKLIEKMHTGVPVDTVDNRSELALWVLAARKANQNAEAAIKGDSNADFLTIKKVLDLMQACNVKKFNFTTNLEKVDIQTVTN